MPNIVFKSILWLIDNKFLEEAEYLYSNYSFTEFQKQLYGNIKEKITKHN